MCLRLPQAGTDGNWEPGTWMSCVSRWFLPTRCSGPSKPQKMQGQKQKWISNGDQTMLRIASRCLLRFSHASVVFCVCLFILSSVSSGHLYFPGLWSPVFLVSECGQYNPDTSPSCLHAPTPRLRQLCVCPGEPRWLPECVWRGSDTLRVPFGSDQEDVHGRRMPFSLREAKALFYSELCGIREPTGQQQLAGGGRARAQQLGIQSQAAWAMYHPPRSWLPLEPVQGGRVPVGTVLQLSVVVPAVPFPETGERKVSHLGRLWPIPGPLVSSLATKMEMTTVPRWMLFSSGRRGFFIPCWGCLRRRTFH